MEETTADTDLDRIAPSTVLDLYLTERETDLADSTRRSHRYTIERLVEWCEDNDISTVADRVGVARQSADERLRKLREEGRVESEMVGNSLFWRLAEE